MKELMLHFKNKEGEKVKESTQLKIGEQVIQTIEFMDTETYFQLAGMNDPDNPQKQMKAQGYFMMKKLIINPKINDILISKLPWDGFMKIVKALREEFLPEEAFLELGVQLEEPSAK